MKKSLWRLPYLSPEISEISTSAETVLCVSDPVYGGNGEPGDDLGYEDFTI